MKRGESSTTILRFLILLLVAGCQAQQPSKPDPNTPALIPIRFTLDKPQAVTVVVDDAHGKRVRNLFGGKEFTAGTHTVLLVTEDGRRKSFRVEVSADHETRKIWLFDEDRWSESD